MFGTIGHTLSHGDDIYNGWSKVEPAFPASLLLISNYTFNYWLAGSGGDCDNIGGARSRSYVNSFPANWCSCTATTRRTG